MQIRRAVQEDWDQLSPLWARADSESPCAEVRSPMQPDHQRSGAGIACAKAIADANVVLFVAEDSESRIVGFAVGRIEASGMNAYVSTLRHWATYASEEGQRIGAYAALQAAWQAVDVATDVLLLSRQTRADGEHDGFGTLLQMRGWRPLHAEWGRRMQPDNNKRRSE